MSVRRSVRSAGRFDRSIASLNKSLLERSMAFSELLTFHAKISAETFTVKFTKRICEILKRFAAKSLEITRNHLFEMNLPVGDRMARNSIAKVVLVEDLYSVGPGRTTRVSAFLRLFTNFTKVYK